MNFVREMNAEEEGWSLSLSLGLLEDFRATLQFQLEEEGTESYWVRGWT